MGIRKSGDRDRELVAGCLLGGAVFLWGNPLVHAADLYVDVLASCATPDGSESNPFCEIQDATLAAEDGDVIRIAPGTYFESLRFIRHSVTLVGTAGAEQTVIDGQDHLHAIDVDSSTPLELRFRGLTVKGGIGAAVSVQGNEANHQVLIEDCVIRDSLGGGVLTPNDGEMTLRRCRISGNRGNVNRGAIRVTTGTVFVEDCEIEDNGGGIWIENFDESERGAAWVTRCRIAKNEYENGAGIRLFGEFTFLCLTDSVVTGNSATNFAGNGGGIHCGGDLVIVGSEITDNTANNQGGGIYLSDRGSVVLSRSTVAGNTAVVSGGGISNPFGIPLTIDHSILAENASPVGPDCQGPWTSAGYVCIGNAADSTVVGGVGDLLDIDPVFYGASGPRAAPTYGLHPTSPCVDAGDPGLAVGGMDLARSPRQLDGDLDGVRVVDLGAYEHNNARLSLSSVRRGGSVRVRVTGRPGLPVCLFVSDATAELLNEPFGSLFVDLNPGSVVIPLSTNPAIHDFSLPTHLEEPTILYFQALTQLPGSAAGNYSNVESLLLEPTTSISWLGATAR